MRDIQHSDAAGGWSDRPAAGWSPTLISVCQGSWMLAARVGWDGEEQTRGQEEVSVSLGNRKSLFSCSWGWEEDLSSGESSVLPAEDPCTPSVALVTSILCLRGNFTSSQGLRELCQTHSLLLCELAQWGLWLQLQQSSAPLFSPWLQKGVHFVV